MGDDSVALDDVDRGVLHLLQVDARNATAEEMAERVGVSASTVRNRISKLEEGGVIQGYRPILDYERANLPLRVLFICTVRARERAEMAQKVMNVKGVITVKEMITSVENLHVEAVGTDTTDLVRITDALQDMELEIRSSELLKGERVQPFNFHLGQSLDEE
ncbi:Lrp/AsnC family transcriptional regulator [Halalkalicoccus ordinarius]|uniref:Lrp/AsnC family transcriptional regulator n=1 Tax=Halalkalicoccus ordinarius TaxID=3116651 RepID=UPI00300F0609